MKRLCKRTEKTKPEDAISFAKELGYDFTLEELAEAMNEGRELFPDDLASVAGGSVIGAVYAGRQKEIIDTYILLR